MVLYGVRRLLNSILPGVGRQVKSGMQISRLLTRRNTCKLSPDSKEIPISCLLTGEKCL
jgi:hypothetical protein